MLVGRLQETRAKMAMDLNRTPDHPLDKRIGKECHASWQCKGEARKLAIEASLAVSMGAGTAYSVVLKAQVSA